MTKNEREKPYGDIEIYFLADRAIVPTTADTQSGFTISIEPVQVFNYGDKSRLLAALKTAADRGIQTVADPPEDQINRDESNFPGFKNPPVLKYAGVGSWDELERKSIYFSIECYPSGFLVDSWGRASDGKWSEEESLKLRLPASVGLNGVADEILNHLKTRRDLPGLMSASA